jgi:hypothetical protein
MLISDRRHPVVVLVVQSAASSSPPVAAVSQIYSRDVLHSSGEVVAYAGLNPRQHQSGTSVDRVVAYLAGIGERDITRLGAQCGFWERVTRQLNRLSNRISAEDRKRVERVLQERVPCPTRLQYDQWHSEGTRLLGSDRVTPPVENWPR